MASTTLNSPLLPQQQQPAVAGEAEANSGAASSSRSTYSGSIGPFFAVISVLTVLAIISCYLGRICRKTESGMRAGTTPLDSIKDGGFFGRMKRRSRQCMDGEVEAGAKVMSFGEDHKNDGKGDCKDGKNPADPSMQA